MCCFSIGAHDAYWVRIKTWFAQIKENLESHAKYTIQLLECFENLTKVLEGGLEYKF